MTTTDKAKRAEPERWLDGTAPKSRELTGLVTRALGRLWGRIAARHPGIPDAVIVLASGDLAGGRRWGHWARSRWKVEGQARGEVLVAGELFDPEATHELSKLRPQVRALAVLLHEAAHALADARKVDDTSRGGRYHNQRYKALAEELGLDVGLTIHGWNQTLPTLSAIASYERELEALREVLRGYREPEPVRPPRARRERSSSDEGGESAGDEKEPTSGKRVLATCDCPRKIRLSRSVLEVGAITCGVCDADFTEER